jgi:hypothetical protein
MSLLDMIKPDLEAPDRKIIKIDPQTNQLIDEGIQRAGQTPDQIAARHLEGVDQAAGLARQSDQQAAQQQASLGYSSPGMNQAIRNQYNSQAGQEINRLKNAYGQNAEFEKSAQIQQAFAQAQARQNVTLQSYSRLMDAYNATEGARAQMLSSILGAGGSAMGAYAGMHNKKTKAAAAQSPTQESLDTGAMSAESNPNAYQPRPGMLGGNY